MGSGMKDFGVSKFSILDESLDPPIEDLEEVKEYKPSSTEVEYQEAVMNLYNPKQLFEPPKNDDNGMPYKIGTLIVIHGESGSGKTSLVIDEANKKPLKTLFISLEMREEELKGDFYELDKKCRVYFPNKLLTPKHLLEIIKRVPYEQIIIDHKELLLHHNDETFPISLRNVAVDYKKRILLICQETKAGQFYGGAYIKQASDAIIKVSGSETIGEKDYIFIDYEKCRPDLRKLRNKMWEEN